jgi:hypothetical protein
MKKSIQHLTLLALLSVLVYAPDLQAQERGDNLRVGLVTMGPGPEIWEKFGHNAILVEDTVLGTSKWYNYGMFSFAQENFILKFAQGRMEYWMEGHDPRFVFPAYVQRERTVQIQYLRLTESQKADLKEFLENNDTPRNRFYRYDYYRDNCSTRIRDAIDGVLGGQIEAQTANQTTDHTLRFHTQRLTTSEPTLYTALMLALGPSVDAPLSDWEEMFLPLATMEIFRNLTVTTDDGTVLPLVESEEFLFASEVWAVDAAPPGWAPKYLLIGLTIALVIGVLGIRSTACPYARTAFVLVAGGWTLLTGLLGTVLAGLWIATDHSVAYWNENLFLINPLFLILAGLIPLVALKSEAAAGKAQKVGALAAAITILGFLLQALPGMDQVNGQLYALFLLPNIAAGLSTVFLSWWVLDGRA